MENIVGDFDHTTAWVKSWGKNCLAISQVAKVCPKFNDFFAFWNPTLNICKTLSLAFLGISVEIKRFYRPLTISEPKYGYFGRKISRILILPIFTFFKPLCDVVCFVNNNDFEFCKVRQIHSVPFSIYQKCLSVKFIQTFHAQ